MAIAFTIVALSIAATARSDAEVPPEARAVDAQVARAVAGSPARAGNENALQGRIEALIPDSRRNCIAITDTAIHNAGLSLSDAQNDLDAALRLIQMSDVGAWLVRLAAAHEVTLCLDHATDLEAHYRSHLRLLGLNARLSEAGRVVFLAHELAHVPQHPRFSNNRRFSPTDMLLLQRVREAAAEAVATRVLWQLRQQGISAPWQEKLTTAYHDIAETFEATMADNHDIAHELWATRAAFHHWFEADWRLEIYDDLMLKTLSRIADDPIGLIPTSRQLSDRFLGGIGHYAGQRFLINGDGRALIDKFRSEDLPANGQERLDAILHASNAGHEHRFSSLGTEPMSALTPSPLSTSNEPTAPDQEELRK